MTKRRDMRWFFQKRKRLGDLLVESAMITEQQLIDALQKQKNTGHQTW